MEGTTKSQKLNRPIATAQDLFEERRRFAVKMIFLIYILSIMEGPLRKWFAPGFATPLYFLRDPLVIWLYAYCLHRRLIVFGGWVRVWLIFAAVASLMGAIPYMLQGFDPRAWVLGVRTYWLYMPFAFVIAFTVQRADLLRFARWNLVLAIPYAALIILQYKSPSTAWVNSGIGGDEGIAMVALDIVRPYGLFTYTGQNVVFSTFLVAVFFTYCLASNKKRKSVILLIISGIAVASLSVLSGSRGIYAFLSAILLTILVGSYLANFGGRALRINLLVVVGVVLSAYLFVEVFGDAFDAMKVRVEHAEKAGPVWHRAMADLLLWLVPLKEPSVIGHGIGVGTPAIGRLLDRQYLEFGESELMRNVYELGAINGLIMVFLRFAFAAHILIVALRSARAGNPEFLPLAGFAALGLAVAQITFSTLTGFLFWSAAGLVLASERTIKPGKLKTTSRGPVPKKPLKQSRVGRARAVPR